MKNCWYVARRIRSYTGLEFLHDADGSYFEPLFLDGCRFSFLSTIEL